MRAVSVGLLALLLATPAQAASLTFENLWELPATFVSLWADDVQLISSDYGIKALDHLNMSITTTTPFAGLNTLVFALPDRFGAGFMFDSLDMAGPCPVHCSWSSGETDVAANTWMDGTIPIHLLWPSTDGGRLPIMRLTFQASPLQASFDTPAPIQPVPEPGTWLLLATGLLAWGWRQNMIPVLRSTWPKRNDVSIT